MYIKPISGSKITSTQKEKGNANSCVFYCNYSLEETLYFYFRPISNQRTFTALGLVYRSF